MTLSPPQKRTIDFSKIRWGSFTQELKDWNAYGKKPHFKDLKSFAKYILEHKEKFDTTTRRRAQFYTNIIVGKGLA